MITINLHDDKKEKFESFEASLNLDSVVIYDSGYGKDQVEAIENLKIQVQKHIELLQNIDYTQITMVNCFGNALTKLFQI